MMTCRPILMLMLPFGLPLMPPLQAEDAPPNVVLIIGDDQAWFDFGFMGSTDVETPHLDRLAREGAVFERGYVPTSVCNPSLGTLITGRFPHETGIGVRLESPPAPPAVVAERFARHPPLPAVLARRNYLSLQTGKWWEGDYRLAGFTHGMTTGIPIFGSITRGRGEKAGQRGLGRLDRGMYFAEGAEGLRIGREGLDPIFQFVRERGDQPFLIWYAPMLPHAPHNPPRRLFEKYQRPGRDEWVAKYYAMCEWFDESCGELLTFLDEEGLSENTLVVFVVDNGVLPRPPDAARFDYGRSKLTPYETGIRTPVVLRWPGHIQPARFDTLVHTIDLCPTILAACGVASPPGLPGVNLLEVCAGRPVTRETIFGAIFMRLIRQPLIPADTLSSRWCVHGDWKLIVPQGERSQPELFHLADDPHETSDLADRDPERVARLHALLDDWWLPRPSK
jgi:uncharacterized sulfatase